jgi:hypothetical protein
MEFLVQQHIKAHILRRVVPGLRGRPIDVAMNWMTALQRRMIPQSGQDADIGYTGDISMRGVRAERGSDAVSGAGVAGRPRGPAGLFARVMG